MGVALLKSSWHSEGASFIYMPVLHAAALQNTIDTIWLYV